MLIIYIIAAAVIIIGDQLVKMLICANASLGDTLFSFGLFDITYVRNTGAAFSMLSGKLPVLSLISVLFCIGTVIYWIRKKPTQPVLCAALTLMFSGALGNAIDRIFRGYVVDFIQTTFINFPIFNIADIAITIGAVLLMIYVIFFGKDDG